MTMSLEHLAELAAKATPESCPSAHIHPDNPVWGPRLAAFRDAMTPEVVAALVEVAKRATNSAYDGLTSEGKRITMDRLRTALSALESVGR